jgi:rubrerythrin
MASDETPNDEHRSRRALLRTAGVAAAGSSAIALTACGSSAKGSHKKKRTPSDPVQAATDIALLNGALDVEHTAIAAYVAGIPLLTGHNRDAAKQFVTQDYGHAAELSLMVRQAGGTAHDPSPSYALGNPSSEGDVLALLQRIESLQIATYLQVLPRLQPGVFRSIVGAILANEAQHVSVLRAARGMPAIPAALVTGKE